MSRLEMPAHSETQPTRNPTNHANKQKSNQQHPVFFPEPSSAGLLSEMLVPAPMVAWAPSPLSRALLDTIR